MSQLDAITGGLLGVAAGDALGAPVEFLTPAQIQKTHGTLTDIIGGGALKWRPGEGTDDTDLTWAVVDGYLQHPEGGDPLYEAIVRNFLKWRSGGPADIGGTTEMGMSKLQDEGDWHASGMQGESYCGNGSLMRALPTALMRADSAVRRVESATISAITHAHPNCVDSCIAYNEIAAHLVEGSSVAEATQAAASLGIASTVKAVLENAPQLPLLGLGTGGYVLDTLQCAVWAIHQPEDLETVMINLVNRGNDSDTTCAVAGGLLGVLHGASSIPERWRDTLEYRPRMIEAARQLDSLRA